MLNKPLCIGIGGVSRSGKTFLATLLQKEIPDSVVIHQDTYIPHESEIPRIKNHIDWERPEAIDWISFRSAVENALRSEKSVIVEGLMVFQNSDINRLYNKSIFLKISREELFLRKQTDLRWGREPDWYINHIWNSYLSFGQIPAAMNDILLIDGAKDIDLPVIMNYLQQNWL
jgi:uridine kinase